MGKQARAKIGSIGKATTASQRKVNGKQTAKQAAKKAVNRLENEQRATRNAKLRAEGIPTPHEAKRLARQAKRKADPKVQARAIAYRRRAKASSGIAGSV